MTLGHCLYNGREFGHVKSDFHSKNENELLIMYQKKAGEIASWDLNVEVLL